MKGIFTTLNLYERKRKDPLKFTTNPEFERLRERNWCYRFTTPGKDLLHADAVDFDVTINNKLFSQSKEYQEFKKSLRAGMEETQKKQAFLKFVKNALDPPIDEKQFNTIYADLNNAWRSGIIFHFRNAMAHSVKEQGYNIQGLSTVNLNYDSGRWYADVALKDISLEKSGLTYAIPGSIFSRFILIDQSFQFLPETYTANNALLYQFCFNERVLITPKLIAYQAEEQKFEKAVTELEKTFETLIPTDTSDDSPIKKDPRFQLAQEVIDEVKKLKKNCRNKSTLEKLTQVLRAMENLLWNTEHEINHFRQCAHEIGKFSWGKILAGLMLCFAGACLLAISSAAVGISLTAAAAPAALGLIGGSTLIAGGAFLLFQGTRKKPIHEKAQNFIQATLDMREKRSLLSQG